MSNLDFINKKRRKSNFFGTHRILTSWSLPSSCGVWATLRVRIEGRIRRILISIERAIIFIVKRLIIASAIVRKTIEIIIIIYKNMNKVKSYNNISIIGQLLSCKGEDKLMIVFIFVEKREKIEKFFDSFLFLMFWKMIWTQLSAILSSIISTNSIKYQSKIKSFCLSSKFSRFFFRHPEDLSLPNSHFSLLTNFIIHV